MSCRRPVLLPNLEALFCREVESSQVKPVLFIDPNITDLPQWALQSVQHMTPSVLYGPYSKSSFMDLIILFYIVLIW